MNTFIFTLIISIAFVAFMVVALMITYWWKGYHLESDVGSNRHMKAKGIVCTSKTLYKEEVELFGDKVDSSAFCGNVCEECESLCATPKSKDNAKISCS